MYFLVCTLYFNKKLRKKLADTTHTYILWIYRLRFSVCHLETLLPIIPSVSPCEYCMSNVEKSDKHSGGDYLPPLPENFKENFRVLKFLSLCLLCKTIVSWIPRSRWGNRETKASIRRDRILPGFPIQSIFDSSHVLSLCLRKHSDKYKHSDEKGKIQPPELTKSLSRTPRCMGFPEALGRPSHSCH